MAVSVHSLLVTSQTGLELVDLDSRPEPDLLWIAKKRYRDRHPSAEDVHLAIEVSNSNLKSDLAEKAELYAEAQIVEYWIVNAVDSKVHVHRRPKSKATPVFPSHTSATTWLPSVRQMLFSVSENCLTQTNDGGHGVNSSGVVRDRERSFDVGS